MWDALWAKVVRPQDNNIHVHLCEDILDGVAPDFLAFPGRAHSVQGLFVALPVAGTTVPLSNMCAAEAKRQCRSIGVFLKQSKDVHQKGPFESEQSTKVHFIELLGAVAGRQGLEWLQLQVIWGLARLFEASCAARKDFFLDQSDAVKYRRKCSHWNAQLKEDLALHRVKVESEAAYTSKTGQAVRTVSNPHPGWTENVLVNHGISLARHMRVTTPGFEDRAFANDGTRLGYRDCLVGAIVNCETEFVGWMPHTVLRWIQSILFDSIGFNRFDSMGSIDSV